MVRSHPPLVTWPLQTLLADMQTFVLLDVLERSAPLLTFATKHGRYLRKMDKRGIGTLSLSARVANRRVMEVIGQAQGSRFELRHL